MLVSGGDVEGKERRLGMLGGEREFVCRRARDEGRSLVKVGLDYGSLLRSLNTEGTPWRPMLGWTGWQKEEGASKQASKEELPSALPLLATMTTSHNNT